MVFITGRKDSLRVVKPAFKEQIWFHRLENAQITNPNFSPSFSQLFEIFCAQKCSKQESACKTFVVVVPAYPSDITDFLVECVPDM